MYPRSKFQEVLLDIRQEMAREADFDVDLFAEIVRTGVGPSDPLIHSLVDIEPLERSNAGGRRRAASNKRR